MAPVRVSCLSHRMATLSSSIGIIDAPVTCVQHSGSEKRRMLWTYVPCRVVTEYSTAEGSGPVGVQRRLRSLHDEDVIYISSIRRWVGHFKSGGMDIADRYRSGLPVTPATTEAEDEGSCANSG
jgi:hypothetical protein